jgi:hypothetical protein
MPRPAKPKSPDSDADPDPEGLTPDPLPPGWKNWKGDPTSEERRRQLDGLGHVVSVARLVAQVIRDYFPVQGQVWQFQDSSDGHGPTGEVLDALLQLEWLLYPARSAQGAREESVRDFGYVVAPGLWGAFTTAVRHIADQHDALLAHYGWTDRVALFKLPPVRPIPEEYLRAPWEWPGRPTPEEYLGTPWKWPHVPRLPPAV